MNIISKAVVKAANYIIEKNGFDKSGQVMNPTNLPYTARDARMMQRVIMPLQLERITHDIAAWREAVSAAENAWYPSRYKMQRMFVDSILEGHTLACMQKRKDLSALKDFVILNSSGEVDEELSKIIADQTWFDNLLSAILDAQFYGYSLIQLGDLIIEGKEFKFPQLLSLRRWNVEPDRQNLVSIPHQRSGINFMDPNEVDDNGASYYDYSVYVDTPTDVGHSICGYGLLYNVALYGIILKNNLGNNADYTQNFSTPYRHAKTQMTLEEGARQDLENALSNIGSNGYVITPEGVTLDFHESNSGNGYKSYESLEARCEKKISKLILGHSDAMDATPGKLGSGQGDKDESPVGAALLDTEKRQDKFLLQTLNDVALPKLQKLGFPIPKGYKIGVTRDREEIESRKQEDECNKTTAEIAQTMKKGGLKMDAKYFFERTGIPCEEVEDAPIMSPSNEKKPPFSKEVQNRLKELYSHVRV